MTVFVTKPGVYGPVPVEPTELDPADVDSFYSDKLIPEEFDKLLNNSPKISDEDEKVELAKILVVIKKPDITPGVYVEEVSSYTMGVDLAKGSSSSVGIANKGPINEPTFVSNTPSKYEVSRSGIMGEIRRLARTFISETPWLPIEKLVNEMYLMGRSDMRMPVVERPLEFGGPMVRSLDI